MPQHASQRLRTQARGTCLKLVSRHNNCIGHNYVADWCVKLCTSMRGHILCIIVMVYIDMADIVMAYIVMADIVLAYTVRVHNFV